MSRSHCLECGMSFGLVRRSEKYPSTCATCVGGLAVDADCMKCGRIIERHEWRFDNGWSRVCSVCARPQIREKQMAADEIARYHGTGSVEGGKAHRLARLYDDLVFAIDGADDDSMYLFWEEIEGLQRTVGV